MAKKRVDLKKRLDDLRGQPEPPVDVSMQLDTNLYRLLTTLAATEQLTLEAYLVNVLNRHAESALVDRDE